MTDIYPILGSLLGVDTALSSEQDPVQNDIYSFMSYNRTVQPDTVTVPERENFMQCKYCNRFYKSHQKLQEHVRKYCLKQKKYKCISCEYRSRRKDHVLRHAKRKHSELYALTQIEETLYQIRDQNDKEEQSNYNESDNLCDRNDARVNVNVNNENCSRTFSTDQFIFNFGSRDLTITAMPIFRDTDDDEDDYNDDGSPQGYWTILETVPYSIHNTNTVTTITNAIVNSAHLQHQSQQTNSISSQQNSQKLFQHQVNRSCNASNIIASATVVVEIPPEVGIPGNTIHYTIPKTEHQLLQEATAVTETISQTSVVEPTNTESKIHHQEHQQHHIMSKQQLQTHAIVKETNTQRLQHQHENNHHHQQQELHGHHQYIVTDAIVVNEENLDNVQHNQHLLLDESCEGSNGKIKQLEQTTQTQLQQHQQNDYVTSKAIRVFPNKIVSTNIVAEHVSRQLQYVCNVCGKSYKIKGSLKRHKSYECGVAPTLLCPYCPHKCKYKSDLRKHISQKHSNSSSEILIVSASDASLTRYNLRRQAKQETENNEITLTQNDKMNESINIKIPLQDNAKIRSLKMESNHNSDFSNTSLATITSSSTAGNLMPTALIALQQLASISSAESLQRLVPELPKGLITTESLSHSNRARLPRLSSKRLSQYEANRCPLCSRVYRSQAFLNEHMRQEHSVCYQNLKKQTRGSQILIDLRKKYFVFNNDNKSNLTQIIHKRNHCFTNSTVNNEHQILQQSMSRIQANRKRMSMSDVSDMLYEFYKANIVKDSGNEKPINQSISSIATERYNNGINVKINTNDKTSEDELLSVEIRKSNDVSVYEKQKIGSTIIEEGTKISEEFKNNYIMTSIPKPNPVETSTQIDVKPIINSTTGMVISTVAMQTTNSDVIPQAAVIATDLLHDEYNDFQKQMRAKQSKAILDNTAHTKILENFLRHHREIRYSDCEDERDTTTASDTNDGDDEDDSRFNGFDDIYLVEGIKSGTFNTGSLPNVYSALNANLTKHSGNTSIGNLPDESKFMFTAQNSAQVSQNFKYSSSNYCNSYMASIGNGGSISGDINNQNINNPEGDPVYECRHCGKKYRWKSTLRRHENVECGGKEPSHQCPYCPYKSKQRGNLGVHVRKHHSNLPQLASKRRSKYSQKLDDGLSNAIGSDDSLSGKLVIDCSK